MHRDATMHTHLDITPPLAQGGGMRTTVSIDDDLLGAARSLARHRSLTLGEAVSELMRRGLQAPARKAPQPRPSGFPVFPVPEQARPITLEDVKRDEDEP